MKSSIILIIGLALTTSTKAQTTFQRAFGSGQNAFNNKIEKAMALQQTSDGGYIVAGHSDGTGLGSEDVYLVKFDSIGDTLWTRIFGGFAADRARSVIETSDGGFVVCGETESFGVQLNDALLLKTDAFGSLLWTKTYGGSEEDYVSQVIETSDGGLIVVGRTYSFGVGGGYSDAWIIKTDASGVIIWTKTYGSAGDDDGFSIQQTSDGGYIISGKDFSVNYGLLLLKTDAMGDTTWIRTLRDSTFAINTGYSVKQTNDGGYVVAGTSSGVGIGSFDMVLLKTNSVGEVQWSRGYGGTSLDEMFGVVEVAGNGGYAAVGVSTATSGYAQLSVIRTDQNGALIWNKSYHGNYGNEGRAIITTADGGFALAGDVWNTFDNTLAVLYQANDAFLVKTDGSGNSLGCQTDSPPLTAVNMAWTAYPTTFSVGSGATVNSPGITESSSLTNVYDAVLPFSFDITSVLCDTACAGALAVDMCDSAGFYCSGLGPYAYSWSANTGSQTGPSATGLCGGTYQVTVTDAADCIGVGEAVVTSSAMVQELCIVTVDSTSTYNSVVWEKPTTSAIDSFRVYRDIVGTYTHIGSVAYGDLSEFVDNTNGVSPIVTSYRYKVSTVDTCGNESALSAYHETIHLTVSLGTPPAYNLIWDNYEGIGFLYYRILRDSVGNGEFGVIDSVTASNFTYTDPSPPAGNMTYAIEVVHPSGCTADKVKNFNSSKSNTSTGVGGALNASIASNDATPGNCDGNATISATGGTPPYTYLWNTSPVQTTSIATGLCAGSFSVTVTDNVGDSVTLSVLINETSGPLPVAEFTSDKTTIAPGDSVNFIDLSSNTPTSWSWIFTNGTPSTSSDQNPSNIVYNVNGCHDVTLIATNGNGSGNITKTCYIEVGIIGLHDDSRMVSHSIAPNPFEYSTVFRYTCQEREKVAVRIINLLGELVYSFDGYSKAGENEVEWGIELQGVYMLDARIGDRFISEKVIKL